MGISLPFIEIPIKESCYERTFSSSLKDEDLKWHWDEEDRIISPIGETDWKFQFDNSLPIDIKGEIKIDRGKWHRIIKGSGDLKIKVIKIK